MNEVSFFAPVGEIATTAGSLQYNSATDSALECVLIIYTDYTEAEAVDRLQVTGPHDLHHPV